MLLQPPSNLATMAMNSILSLAVAGAVLAGAATAQSEILVTGNIATSTTWTANNTYNLQNQIYVLPGASLTIEAGTVVASDATANGSGGLAVCRGAQIFVRGTATDPVIFTSKSDTATWTPDASHPTGGDPKTGTWRVAANEWGNLTLMGAGYISENATVGNVPTPNASNVAAMEGLIADPANPTFVEYGGGNDDDDSGEISYCSIRYAGRVVGLANELNGLSLGGIGRATDIHHVEIMNNVDDGIEIWGGTVNLRNFSIWNVGDDSFDVDQGWRGKAQFGLIVQGYSANASQGSGVGDNCFETDGAEDSDWLPVTTAAIYNVTVVGQPLDGDHATAWRDNARVQYRNCVFMDIGDRLVSFDNVDGDGANGYGFNGTLSWLATWNTPAAFNAPLYQAQTNGNLAEIKDSVFFNVSNISEATNVGVFNPANNNVTATTSPVQSLTRGAATLVGSKVMAPVTFLDPRPAGDALSSAGFAPNDGFFSSAKYRGGFAPGADWMNGWTASSAFGMSPSESYTDLGYATGGANGNPNLAGTGTTAAGTPFSLNVSNGAPLSLGIYVLGFADLYLPQYGGTIVPNFLVGGNVVTFTGPTGDVSVNLTMPVGTPSGFRLWHQVGIFDAGAPQGVSFTNALTSVTP